MKGGVKWVKLVALGNKQRWDLKMQYCYGIKTSSSKNGYWKCSGISKWRVAPIHDYSKQTEMELKGGDKPCVNIIKEI